MTVSNNVKVVYQENGREIMKDFIHYSGFETSDKVLMCEYHEIVKQSAGRTAVARMIERRASDPAKVQAKVYRLN